MNNAECGMQNDELRMRSTFNILHSAFCILLLAGCATAPAPRSAPATSIDSLLAAPPFQHSFWGIVVEDEAGARRVSGHHRPGGTRSSAAWAGPGAPG